MRGVGFVMFTVCTVTSLLTDTSENVVSLTAVDGYHPLGLDGLMASSTLSNIDIHNHQGK